MATHRATSRRRASRRDVRRSGLRRSAVVAGCTLGLALGVGSATAYMTAPGSGVGAGGTGTATQPLGLTPATVTAALYPGGTAAVATTATNPGDADVRITSLALDPTQGTGGFTVDPAHASCDVAAFAFTRQTNAGAGWSVPGGGSLSISLPASVSASPNAGNACQGATLTIYLKADA
jgi:hypothetical protein